MKTILVVLNSISEAHYFSKNYSEIIEECEIIVLSSPVHEYLKQNNIPNINLSELYSDKEMFDWENQANLYIKEMLGEYDLKYSKNLSEIYELPQINFFEEGFFYLLSVYHIGYIKYKKTLGKYLKSHSNLTRIILFQIKSAPIFEKEIMQDVTSELAHTYSLNYKLENVPIVKDRKELIHKLRRGLYLFLNSKLKFNNRNGTVIDLKEKNFTLILGSLFQLKYITDKLKEKLKIFFLPTGDWVVNEAKVKQKQHADLFKEKFQKKKGSGIEEKYFNILVDTILKNSYKLTTISSLINNNQIKSCIWGNSLISGIDGMLPIIFKKKGIPVLGMQHGSHYGVANVNQQHYYSDFKKCDYFLTYGFNNDDYKETYSVDDVPCEFIPVGMSKQLLGREGNKKTCDVLYLPTNNVNMFIETIRMRFHIQNTLQHDIINSLDRLEGKKVVVKPFMLSNHSNCSFFSLLEKSKNIKFHNHLNTQDILKAFKFDVIIIDMISTPLYEVLEVDSEIFILYDCFRNWNASVIKMLEKRVHFFKDINSLNEILSDYKNNKLERKRNSEFLDKHVYGGDFEIDSIKFMEKMCKV